MSVDDQPLDRPRFSDRSTGLAIFGWLQIVMGGFTALMIPLMLLSLMVSHGAGSNVNMMLPVVVFYAVLAVALIWLGIGSIRTRRWARALTLVLAWMWLAMGVMSSIMMMVLMPRMSNVLAQDEQLPPQAMTFFYVVMLGTMGCMYILLPGIFIVFYQRADVKATCELKDPSIRWTDHCSLPVLSLSLLLGFGATSVIWSAGYGFIVPFFGIVLKGVPGALFFLGFSVLFCYLAWAIYKLKMGAWWTTLGACVVFSVSAIITFSRINLLDFYREMNFPPEQLKIMEDSGVLEMNMPLMMGVYLVVFVGYLLWVRTYLVAGSTAQDT